VPAGVGHGSCPHTVRSKALEQAGRQVPAPGHHVRARRLFAASTAIQVYNICLVPSALLPVGSIAHGALRWCRAGANRATRARRHSAQTTQLAVRSAVHGMRGPVRPHEHDHTELPSPRCSIARLNATPCASNPAGARRRRRRLVVVGLLGSHA
jgi:hypothetical protein